MSDASLKQFLTLSNLYAYVDLATDCATVVMSVTVSVMCKVMAAVSVALVGLLTVSSQANSLHHRHPYRDHLSLPSAAAASSAQVPCCTS